MDHIRFTKLRISLQMEENCTLPKYKVSAIRGGMGQMLLSQNCIRDRNCGSCDFASSCIVRNIMYARYKARPPFAVGGESMGYVIDCFDMRTEYKSGDSLFLDFFLFGDTIAYVMPVIYALSSLGYVGLGKERAPFRVAEVTNRRRKPILWGGDVNIGNVLVETLGQYVRERMRSSPEGGHLTVRLASPCAVKYRGSFLRQFDGRSLILSILRKLYMYRLYEGADMDEERWEEDRFPVVRSQKMVAMKVPRYSTAQQSKMFLEGIQGEMVLDRCVEKVRGLLYGAEILHLGKNTRLGFGALRVE